MAWSKRVAMWWGLCALIFVLILLLGPESWAPWYRPSDWRNPTTQDYWAEISKVSKEGAALEVRKIKDRSTIDDSDIKAQLKSGFKAGDLVRVTHTDSDGKTKLGIETTSEVESVQRLLTLALMAFVLAVLLALLARGKLRLLIVGADNRYSKSKVQLVIWFIVVLTVYLSTLLLRFWHSNGLLLGGISIPAHLLQLAGLSGLSFAAAKGITQSKQNDVENQRAAVQAAAAVPGALTGMTAQGRAFAVMPAAAGIAPETIQGPDPSQVKTTAANPSWRDLLSGDSQAGPPDLGDVQMLLVTLIAVVVYMASAYHFLGALEMRSSIPLPDADQTLLGLLGVSHLTYLGKKATSDPNPPKP